jgi:apolipoprotein D and lipocalin family protein
MKTKNIFCILLLLVLSSCSNKYAPLQVVDKVDLKKYSGKWYEIASIPTKFQEGCNCTSAEYTLSEKGFVYIVNKCNKDSPAGPLEQKDAKAFITKDRSNAKLKVQFFWPFKADYWIIDLDTKDYKYAVVGHPNRKYLWILARDFEMDKDLYAKLVNGAKEKGFPVETLKMTVQEGCW